MIQPNSFSKAFFRAFVWFLVLSGVTAIALKKLDTEIPGKDDHFLACEGGKHSDNEANLLMDCLRISPETKTDTELNKRTLESFKQAQPGNAFMGKHSTDYRPPIPPKPTGRNKKLGTFQESGSQSSEPMVMPEQFEDVHYYENWQVSDEGEIPIPKNQDFQELGGFEDGKSRDGPIAVDKKGQESRGYRRNSFWANFQTRYPTLGDVWDEIFPLDKRMFEIPPEELKEMSETAVPEPKGSHEPTELETSSSFSMNLPEKGKETETETETEFNTNDDSNNASFRTSYSDDDGVETPPRVIPDKMFIRGKAPILPWFEMAEKLRIAAEIHQGLQEIPQSIEEAAHTSKDVSDTMKEMPFDVKQKTGLSGGFFMMQNQEKQKDQSQNQSQVAGFSSANFVMLDVAGIVKTIDLFLTDKRQTAILTATSKLDASVAVGVADGLAGKERSIEEDSEMPQNLCKKAREKFEYSKSNISASGLLDKAYREILKHEEKVTGCAAAAFGVIARDGKATISVIKNSGAALYRNQKLIQKTEIKQHPQGEPYVTVADDIIQAAGSQEIKHTFDMFTDKPDYKWETQPGDVLLFFSADVLKYTKATDFPKFLESNPEDMAKEIAEKFSEFVAGKISTKQKKCDGPQLCNCFPCFRGKPEEFPTDISLVVVKVT